MHRRSLMAREGKIVLNVRRTRSLRSPSGVRTLTYLFMSCWKKFQTAILGQKVDDRKAKPFPGWSRLNCIKIKIPELIKVPSIHPHTTWHCWLEIYFINYWACLDLVFESLLLHCGKQGGSAKDLRTKMQESRFWR